MKSSFYRPIVFPVAEYPYLPWFAGLATDGYPPTDDPTPPALGMGLRTYRRSMRRSHGWEVATASPTSRHRRVRWPSGRIADVIKCFWQCARLLSQRPSGSACAPLWAHAACHLRGESPPGSAQQAKRAPLCAARSRRKCTTFGCYRRLF